jgi:diguanylate cyclase (GGDEF)-like protein
MGRRTGSERTDVLDGIASPVMLLAYAVAVPFIVFLFFMGGDLRHAIPAAESERLGLAQVGALQQMMVDTAHERTSQACGTRSDAAAIDRDIVAVEALQRERPFATGEWSAALAAWQAGPTDARPSAVIENLIEALRITSDESKLTYDPEVRGIDIADALTYRLPDAVDAFRRAQTSLCVSHGVTAAARLELERESGALQIQLADVSNDVLEAIGLKPPFVAAVADAERRAEASSSAALEAVDRVAADPSVEQQRRAARATDAAAADLERLTATLAPSMGAIVEERLVSLNHRLILTLAPSIIAILAGILVGILGVRNKMHIAEMAKLRAHQLELSYQATHDALTSLPNRAAFFAKLDETLEHSRSNGGSVAVLFIDLDNFKAVNDSYGHAAGDEVLRHAAQRLTSICATAGGRMTARIGGDEFAMLIASDDPITVRERIALVFDGIENELKRPLGIETFEAAPLRISASVGVAFQDGLHAPTRVASDILREADAAMYESKAKSRERESTLPN